MATPKNHTPLPSRYTSRARAVRRDYVKGVLDGTIPAPAPGTPEANSLAKLASLARWGKAPKGMRMNGPITGTMMSPDPMMIDEDHYIPDMPTIDFNDEAF